MKYQDFKKTLDSYFNDDDNIEFYSDDTCYVTFVKKDSYIGDDYFTVKTDKDSIDIEVHPEIIAKRKEDRKKRDEEVYRRIRDFYCKDLDWRYSRNGEVVDSLPEYSEQEWTW